MMPDHSVEEVNFYFKNCLIVSSNDHNGFSEMNNVDSDSDTISNKIISGDNTETRDQSTIADDGQAASSVTRDICKSYYQNVKDDTWNSSEMAPVNRFLESQKSKKSDTLSNVKATCCSVCGKIFRSTRDLANHKFKVHSRDTKQFQCSKCDRMFYHKYDLNKHVLDTHSGSNYTCEKCKSCFKTRYNLNRHSKKC